MSPPPCVTVHLHTDGPIPGPHSLLTLTSTAFTASGSPTSAFGANLHELPGATPHPDALESWRGRAEDWLCTRRATCPPTATMSAYAAWLATLPGVPVLLTEPAGTDHLFLFWYLQRYTGRWPFAAVRRHGPVSTDDARHCPLIGCRTSAPAALVG